MELSLLKNYKNIVTIQEYCILGENVYDCSTTRRLPKNKPRSPVRRAQKKPEAKVIKFTQLKLEMCI